MLPLASVALGIVRLHIRLPVATEKGELPSAQDSVVMLWPTPQQQVDTGPFWTAKRFSPPETSKEGESISFVEKTRY